jgi:hypothetical protein
MQAGLLEFANDAYRLLRNGMQERDEALGERKRFGQMLYAANEDCGSCVPSCAPCGRCTRNHRTDPAPAENGPCATRKAANDAAARFDPTAVVGWKCRGALARGAARSEARTRAVPARSAGLDVKEPDSAVSCVSCCPAIAAWRPHGPSAADPRTGCAIGRARTARSDAVRVVGAGAGYGRASVYVPCALPVARRPSRCLTKSVEWAICRSRRCFQRAESVSSWVPPVGRGS